MQQTKSVTAGARTQKKLSTIAQAMQDEKEGFFFAAAAGYRVAGDEAGGHSEAARRYAKSEECRSKALCL